MDNIYGEIRGGDDRNRIDINNNKKRIKSR